MVIKMIVDDHDYHDDDYHDDHDQHGSQGYHYYDDLYEDSDQA